VIYFTMQEWNGESKLCIGCLMYGIGKIISGHKIKLFKKNMNMSRKLALNLAGIYKNKHSKKTPMSHIMFDCLMDPLHLLTVLGKN